jgi:hypothetical protein
MPTDNYKIENAYRLVQEGISCELASVGDGADSDPQNKFSQEEAIQSLRYFRQHHLEGSHTAAYDLDKYDQFAIFQRQTAAGKRQTTTGPTEKFYDFAVLNKKAGKFEVIIFKPVDSTQSEPKEEIITKQQFDRLPTALAFIVAHGPPITEGSEEYHKAGQQRIDAAIQRLVNYINSHDMVKAHYDPKKNKIVGATISYDPATKLKYNTYNDIDPTYEAVRNWLGY